MVHGDLAITITRPAHALYAETVERARHYLSASGQRLSITVVQAATLEGAAEKLALLAPLPPTLGPVAFLHLDGAGPTLDEQLEAFYGRLAEVGMQAVRSPYATMVHWRTAPWANGVHVLHDRCLERVLDAGRPWLLATEHLTALVDFAERTFEKPRNHKMAIRNLDTTLGDEITRFLSDRAGDGWTFFYYTGSSVSPLIDHLERAARQRGALVLRGANEHALASGALAGHLLHERPFLIVIGTAMMDEFRGTFANLRAAGARGFVICPSPTSTAISPSRGRSRGTRICARCSQPSASLPSTSIASSR